MFTARDLRDAYLELTSLGRWVEVGEIVDVVADWAPAVLVERAVCEAEEVFDGVLVASGSIMFRC